MKTFFLPFAAALLLGQGLLPGSNLRAADPYAELPAYRWNQPRAAVQAIEAEIRAARPDQLPAIESKLLQALQSPAATADAKAWICRTLRMAGSERSVSVLAPLLLDEALAADARFALRSLPGPKPAEALRQALPNARGPLKSGLILVLGARGDRLAVPLLGPLAGGGGSGGGRSRIGRPGTDRRRSRLGCAASRARPRPAPNAAPTSPAPGRRERAGRGQHRSGRSNFPVAARAERRGHGPGRATRPGASGKVRARIVGFTQCRVPGAARDRGPAGQRFQ